ncbi:MAG: rRNA maturation RNase YbeY [Fimbriimonadaceae bacterium]
MVNQLPKRKVYEPLVRAVRIALTQNHAPSAEVVVSLAPSQLLLELNQQFRKIDSTTDVLTFPSPQRFSESLGDVIINWEMAESQASLRGVKPIEEAAMLAVHGALHLLGFDDHTNEDRSKMIEAMNRAMSESGLPTDNNWSSLPHEEPVFNG